MSTENTEQSRMIALSFLENFSAGRVDVALGLLADDATWWVGGTPGQYGLAGTYSKAQLLDLLQRIGAQMPKGVQSRVFGVTAEGGRVAVEVDARAATASGGEYHNFLHFLFEVRGGKIVSVREYLDTLHAQRALVEPH
jgi:ketosteroid isomerase-like protein